MMPPASARMEVVMVCCVLVMVFSQTLCGPLRPDADSSSSTGGLSHKRRHWRTHHFGRKDCIKCQPGSYAIKPCFHKTSTVCHPCPPNTFTSWPNLYKRCRPCSKCSKGFFQIEECTNTSDTACQACTPSTCPDLDPDVEDMMLGDDHTPYIDDAKPTALSELTDRALESAPIPKHKLEGKEKPQQDEQAKPKEDPKKEGAVLTGSDDDNVVGVLLGSVKEDEGEGSGDGEHLLLEESPDLGSLPPPAQPTPVAEPDLADSKDGTTPSSHQGVPSDSKAEQDKENKESDDDVKEVEQDKENEESNDDVKEVEQDTENEESNDDVKEVEKDTENEESNDDVKEVEEQDKENEESNDDVKEVAEQDTENEESNDNVKEAAEQDTENEESDDNVKEAAEQDKESDDYDEDDTAGIPLGAGVASEGETTSPAKDDHAEGEAQPAEDGNENMVSGAEETTQEPKSDQHAAAPGLDTAPSQDTEEKDDQEDKVEDSTPPSPIDDDDGPGEEDDPTDDTETELSPPSTENNSEEETEAAPHPAAPAEDNDDIVPALTSPPDHDHEATTPEPEGDEAVANIDDDANTALSSSSSSSPQPVIPVVLSEGGEHEERESPSSTPLPTPLSEAPQAESESKAVDDASVLSPPSASLLESAPSEKKATEVDSVMTTQAIDLTPEATMPTPTTESSAHVPVLMPHPAQGSEGDAEGEDKDKDEHAEETGGETQEQAQTTSSPENPQESTQAADNVHFVLEPEIGEEKASDGDQQQQTPEPHTASPEHVAEEAAATTATSLDELHKLDGDVDDQTTPKSIQIQPAVPETTPAEKAEDEVDVVLVVDHSPPLPPSSTHRIPTLEEVEEEDLGSGDVPGIVVGGGGEREEEKLGVDRNVTEGAKEGEGGVNVVVAQGGQEEATTPPSGQSEGGSHVPEEVPVILEESEKKPEEEAEKKPEEDTEEKHDEVKEETPEEESEGKHDEEKDEKPEEKPDEGMEEKPEGEEKEKPDEEKEQKPEEETEDTLVVVKEEKLEDGSEEKPDEGKEQEQQTPEEKPDEEKDDKPEEKPDEEKDETPEEKVHEEKDDKPEEKVDEEMEETPEEKPDEEKVDKPEEEITEKPDEEEKEKEEDKEPEDKSEETLVAGKEEKPEEEMEEKPDEEKAEEAEEETTEKPDGEKEEEDSDVKHVAGKGGKPDEETGEKPEEEKPEQETEQEVAGERPEHESGKEAEGDEHTHSYEDVEVEVVEISEEDLEIQHAKHGGDTEEDEEGKRRTAIIVGVAMGAVALFALGFVLSRQCRKRGGFKVMKKVPYDNGTATNGNSESIEFRPMRSGSGIYDEVDEMPHPPVQGSYKKVPPSEGGYTPLPTAATTITPTHVTPFTTAPNGDTYAVVNKKKPQASREDFQEPHLNGIGHIRYIDETTTDEEGSEPTPRDRLLPQRHYHAALPEVEEEESRYRPPEPETRPPASSFSGDSLDSLPTEILRNVESQLLNGGSNHMDELDKEEEGKLKKEHGAKGSSTKGMGNGSLEVAVTVENGHA